MRAIACAEPYTPSNTAYKLFVAEIAANVTITEERRDVVAPRPSMDELGRCIENTLQSVDLPLRNSRE